MLCAACFLMLMMTSCLSQEQKMLKNEVENMNRTLPQEVAGVTFNAISYNSDKDIVTLELVAGNSIAEMAVTAAPALVKQGLITYLKSTSSNADLVYAIRKANATLVCPCYNGSEQEIISFNITAQELD